MGERIQVSFGPPCWKVAILIFAGPLVGSSAAAVGSALLEDSVALIHQVANNCLATFSLPGRRS